MSYRLMNRKIFFRSDGVDCRLNAKFTLEYPGYLHTTSSTFNFSRLVLPWLVCFLRFTVDSTLWPSPIVFQKRSHSTFPYCIPLILILPYPSSFFSKVSSLKFWHNPIARTMNTENDFAYTNRGATFIFYNFSFFWTRAYIILIERPTV